MTLRSQLTYEPLELKFGTSGRRGQVIHLTQLEIYINALAELRYLLALPASEGGILAGDEFYFACDLRPSSTRYLPEEQGRGEIAQAVVRAIRDAGLNPVYLGQLPTPALTYYALERGKGSIMVTGSHIPFDRNGYKLNTAHGELLKHHEAPISEAVRLFRDEIYRQEFSQSLFDSDGRFKAGHSELPPHDDRALRAYLERYTHFFGGRSLAGRRIIAYQHSAVGRDLLVQLLRAFGAEVIPAGRSDTFVPIDTENIDASELGAIQKLADEATAQHGPAWAVVSTDGDSDRPLILGVDSGKVRFFPGDLVGIVAAEFLGADAVVVPISCNDAIDRGALAGALEPKTRIGSPFVIAGMEQARAKGRKVVCGWEANGGFLLGSDIWQDGRTLRRLATRDAFLPILCVLLAAHESGISLTELFARLPKRYSRAALLRNFPRPVSLKILQLKSFAEYFPRERGFGEIAGFDYTDGVRIRFDNGEIAHIRPSGNADELRIYAVADTQDRADAIAAMGVAEPDGILRRLERAVR